MVRKFQKHISQLMVVDFYLECVFGLVGSMVKQSYCPFATFFPFFHLCSDGFINRWQQMIRGAKGEISRPSHSLSSFVTHFLKATAQLAASAIDDVAKVPSDNKQ